MKTTTYWAAFAALVIAGVTGCSNDSSEVEEPDVLSSSQVCDGTLSPAAAAALERIGGTDGFTEIQIAGDKDYRWSLEEAEKHLQGAAFSHRCHVYKEDDESGHPLMSIRFSAKSSHPDPVEAAPNRDRDKFIYPLGLYAATTGYIGADLYFACPTEGAKGRMPYVQADMFSLENQMKPGSSVKDRMTILNSVSRALAEELGCTAQAKLPAKVPDALSE
ncbi:hypothetical protein ACIREO_29150 [Streptomyces sp. NPDC102441]|uniref:hypothetical protein n=1 Tax=Streptomyces sp. NPDC102441 TaxID=3366176 RepID=UPI0038106CE0